MSISAMSTHVESLHPADHGTGLLSSRHALALTDQAIVTWSVLNTLLILYGPAGRRHLHHERE